jgi:small subunit ribosomal protein S20
LAHSPRGWSGARSPSAIKRVRQSERRRAINQPRRSAAKTLVAKAVAVASNGASPEDIEQAVRNAVAALDRAARAGVIHRNAADRRKSRLMLKVNAAVGGAELVAVGKRARTTGKAAAAKQAKARIAASRAGRGKDAQTAAGKARAALARTTRASAGAATAEAPAADTPPAKPKQASAGTSRSSSRSRKPSAEAAAGGEGEAKPRASRGSAKKS